MLRLFYNIHLFKNPGMTSTRIFSKFNLFSLAITVFVLFTGQYAIAQSQLVKNLQEGKNQLVVVYGTSLSSGNHGESWMHAVAEYFNGKYGNHLKYTLSGKGGMWSTWGVQHLEDSVITKNPDVVIMEFGMNDAVLRYNTSPEVARLNLEYMIQRILLANPNCEVILQVMNMPIRKSAGYRPNLNAYYDMYRDVAKKRDLLLIDHYPNWQKILDQGEETFLNYVPDGLHPNDESGRTVIAPMIIKTLESK